MFDVQNQVPLQSCPLRLARSSVHHDPIRSRGKCADPDLNRHERTPAGTEGDLRALEPDHVVSRNERAGVQPAARQGWRSAGDAMDGKEPARLSAQ